MEVRNLKRRSTSNVTQTELPKGHANGFLYMINLTEGFDMKDLGHDLLNATLRTTFEGDKVEYLSSNVPINPLISVSDITFGSTGVLSNIINNSLTVGADSVEINEVKTEGSKSDKDTVSALGTIMGNSLVFYVDYGSVYCDNGDELHTQIEFNTMDAVESVSIASISRRLDPHFTRQYDIDFDLNEKHQNISAAYVYSDTLDVDANIVVDAETTQYDSDLDGFQSAQMIFGQVENVHTGTTCQIFETKDGIAENVWFKVTKNGSKGLNTDGNRFGILTIRLVFDEKIASGRSYKNLQDSYKRVSTFVSENPSQARAMQSAGLVPTLEQIRSKMNILQTFSKRISKAESLNTPT